MTGGPATTVASREEVQRLINAVRADPTLRDELERAILADKLLHLPEQVAILIDIMRSFAEAADKQFAALHKRLGNVEADVSTLKADVNTLKINSGNIRGKLLEQQVRNNPGRFLGRYARRLKALSVDEVLDSNGVALDDERYGVLSRADAFLTGSERGTGYTTVIVVEATWRVSTDDVKRTAALARLLNSVGIVARGAIISVEPPRDSVRRAAEAESLWVVVDSYDKSAA